MAGLFDAGSTFNSGSLFTSGVQGFDSGNNSSGSRVGGRFISGSDGGGSGSTPITKQTSSRQNQGRQLNRTTNLNSTTNRTSSTNELENRNIQNVTDPVLQAINQAVQGNATNPTLVATDEGRLANIEAILQQLEAFDAEAIQQGAEGDVSQLNRQLLEDILPQITGASEASGTSNNALAAILAQDAASRTAEAGARVREDARSNAASEFVNLVQSLSQAASGGSAIQDSIASLVQAAKGTVEQGTIGRVSDTVSQDVTTGTETTRETGDTTTEGEELVSDSSVNSAIAGQQQNQRLQQLALLQSALSPFQTLQDLNRPSTGFGGGPGGQARRESSQSVNRLASLIGL